VREETDRKRRKLIVNKDELEALLQELDTALVKAFPGPEPISMLIVGGACLIFAGVSTRQTEDIDVIITDLFGTGKAGLVYDPNPTEQKIRDIIESIGKKHRFKKKQQMFLNDDCAPFLIELGDLPATRIWKKYQKMHLYLPADLSYILACKFIAARADKDYGDITILRTMLGVSTKEQAREIVNRFFPDYDAQEFFGLSKNLDEIFGLDE
jgi:hypothetical protein